MNTTEARRQISFTLRPSGVAFLLLDSGGKVNSLGSEVTRELEPIVERLAEDPRVKAAVIMSGKPDTFIIGADLFEIRKATDPLQIYRLSRDGQNIFNKISALPKPVVVAINGACLGGGLELALAAHYRLASNAPATQLGLPETRLGLIPGLGGTQRLPRLIGLKAALSLILSAEPLSAQEALALNLVDEVVPADELFGRAEARALELIDESDFVEKQRNLYQGSFEPADNALCCQAYTLAGVDKEKARKLFAMSERSIRIKTRGNYPAQTRVLEVMKEGLFKGFEQGLEAETRGFSELAISEVAGNLIALFFTTDFARQSAASLTAKFPGNSVQTVGIVGSGTMGSAIAHLSAASGLNVLLRVNKSSPEEALERVSGHCSRLKPTGHSDTAGSDSFISRVEGVTDDNELCKADLVLESVVEDLDVKKSVLATLSAVLLPESVIASNTSSLPLSDLSDSVKQSDRFLGLHFFHPVDKMPLVEVVSHKTTSRKTLARALDFVLRLGKTPVIVKDGPGFLINRLLTCYLQEAARMAESAIPLNWIEEAAIDFGMPMGPLELLDEVGLDVAFKVASSLHQSLGERMAPPQILAGVQALGLVGKKTGAGVYSWDESGRRLRLNPDLIEGAGCVVVEEKSTPEMRLVLAERLILPMVDEAARCMEDRIVMRPREVDMAIVLAIGFPAFRGGLLKYADKLTLPRVSARLADIYAASVSCRQVSGLIEKYIAAARGFYFLGGGKEEE